jgi:hypothetical protein
VIEFAGFCESLTILNNGDALAVLDCNTGKLLEHCQLRKDPCYKMVWDRSYANKLGRLCQGVGTRDNVGGKRVAGTNTYHLIAYADIPHLKQKKIIYTKVVCEVRKGKDDENCTRITVGGNLICYPGNTGTNTALLDLIKLMLNSVISRKGAQFACIDIKKFYLNTPIEDPEYVRIKITDIPEEFILEYGLAGKDDINGWISFEIRRGCYGLPQAGILANNLLCERLEEEGYYEAHSTPGLWKHKWHPIQFCLVVDDFGIEYMGIKHFSHLSTLLKSTTKSKPIWRAKKLQVSMSNGTF